MFYHIRAHLPSWAITEALKFIFPHRCAAIDEIDTSNADAFRSTTRELKLFSEWLQEMCSVVETSKSSHPGIRMINPLSRGYELYGAVRIYTALSFGTDYNLGLDLNIRTVKGMRILSHLNSKFIIDLDHSRWRIIPIKSGELSIRNANIPLGVEGAGISSLSGDKLNRAELLNCMLLGLMPELRFQNQVIEEDLITKARKLCQLNEILDEEDLAFLDDESKFLVKGVHNALSF